MCELIIGFIVHGSNLVLVNMKGRHIVCDREVCNRLDSRPLHQRYYRDVFVRRS